jgi:hypothetical protein
LLTVGLVVRTENERLKTVGSRLKGSNDLRRDPDRIKCPDIGDLEGWQPGKFWRRTASWGV